MRTRINSDRGPMIAAKGILPGSGAGIVHTLAAMMMVMILGGCDGPFDSDSSNKVNGSIDVAAGTPADDVSTVNGSIHVDDSATVKSATTVNGSVRVGAHATAASLTTVNGAISVGAATHVTGEVAAVNGDLTLAEGADVFGPLANVKGKIRLVNAHVARGIKTVGGNISVMGTSHVEGGILVEKPSGSSFFNSEDPLIIIGPGATVQGELRFERKVKLFVSDHATIGAVTGATPIPFSGDDAPN